MGDAAGRNAAALIMRIEGRMKVRVKNPVSDQSITQRQTPCPSNISHSIGVSRARPLILLTENGPDVYKYKPLTEPRP